MLMVLLKVDLKDWREDADRYQLLLPREHFLLLESIYRIVLPRSRTFLVILRNSLIMLPP